MTMLDKNDEAKCFDSLNDKGDEAGVIKLRSGTAYLITITALQPRYLWEAVSILCLDNNNIKRIGR